MIWWRLVRRALLLWVLVRLTLVLVVFATRVHGIYFGSGASAVNAMFGSGLMAAFLGLVVTAIMLIDLRGTREHVFLANLAVGARHAVLVTLVTVAVPESATAVVFTLLGS
jgi:hypothetical protein